MDAKYYNNKYRPFFKKVSEYPEGHAPENYVLSYALKVSSPDKILLNLGCSWGKYNNNLLDSYAKIYNVDSDPEIIQYFHEKTKNLPNLVCQTAPPEELTFYNKFFDVVLSQRGPLMNSQKTFLEAQRVLKPGGYLIATVTGEEDLIDVKRSFNRGINFLEGDYINSVEKQIKDWNHAGSDKITFQKIKHLKYNEYFQDIESFVNLLEVFPIIPNFDTKNETDYKALLSYVKENFVNKSVLLKRHVIFIIGQKNG